MIRVQILLKNAFFLYNLCLKRAKIKKRGRVGPLFKNNECFLIGRRSSRNSDDIGHRVFRPTFACRHCCISRRRSFLSTLLWALYDGRKSYLLKVGRSLSPKNPRLHHWRNHRTKPWNGTFKLPLHWQLHAVQGEKHLVRFYFKLFR